MAEEWLRHTFSNWLIINNILNAGSLGRIYLWITFVVRTMQFSVTWRLVCSIQVLKYRLNWDVKLAKISHKILSQIDKTRGAAWLYSKIMDCEDGFDIPVTDHTSIASSFEWDVTPRFEGNQRCKCVTWAYMSHNRINRLTNKWTCKANPEEEEIKHNDEGAKVLVVTAGTQPAWTILFMSSLSNCMFFRVGHENGCVVWEAAR
jgi:hypothetical protein